MACVLSYGGGLKLIATFIPIFSRIPITPHEKGNATRSSQTVTTVTTSGSGVAPRCCRPRAQPISKVPAPYPLPPRAAAAAAFSYSCSLEESHRLQIQPTSQSIFFFFQNHSQSSPFRARSTRTRCPRQSHRVPFSPLRAPAGQEGGRARAWSFHSPRVRTSALRSLLASATLRPAVAFFFFFNTEIAPRGGK